MNTHNNNQNNVKRFGLPSIITTQEQAKALWICAAHESHCEQVDIDDISIDSRKYVYARVCMCLKFIPVLKEINSLSMTSTGIQSVLGRWVSPLNLYHTTTHMVKNVMTVPCCGGGGGGGCD